MVASAREVAERRGMAWAGKIGGRPRRVQPEETGNVDRSRYPEPHRSLTALLFGDPRPGRSALDRQQIEAAEAKLEAPAG